MPDVMERINLNVPPSVRRDLRELADREGRTEAEVARTLLVAAIARTRREERYRQIANAQTPAIRARDLAILRAFERLGG